MDSLQEQLSVLRKAYATQLQERVAHLETLWRERDDELSSDGRLQEIYLLAHRLAGSGASFGFPAIGTAARTLELHVRALLDLSRSISPLEREQIEQSLAMLRAVSAQAVATADDISQAKQAQVALPYPLHINDSRLVYLVASDLALARDLARQIEPFGYVVRIFAQLADLEQAFSEMLPAALLVDLDSPGDKLLGTAAIEQSRHLAGPHLPVIATSAHSDLLARLKAVRSGCDAYVTKPIDIGMLIDKLDDLTLSQLAEPIRILVIDDEADLAAFYAQVLQGAGMLTETLSDPLYVLELLNEFRPDLLLMDLYMPGCNGLELAKVIRQQPAYVGMPIVFLSAETDLDKQLAAMRIGGDDFLTKSIRPEQLISAIASRAQRSIQLRSLMKTDSLTNLLNHTAFKERLDLEVARSLRLAAPLALALIDIDHFKLVNDTYGHPTGDRVLRSLSRLLQQRLRKTDAIGRYGGEEFGVILPNTSGDMAFRILQELRASFAQIRHQAEHGEFSVTFSCGVAMFPKYHDAIALNDAADKALYEAKRSGRNRVLPATSPSSSPGAIS